MHVVHLETGRNLYGGARQVLQLMAGLSGHQVQSTLVCPPNSAISAAAGATGAVVRDMSMGGDLDITFWPRFAACLRELGPDLVHVHSRRGADVWGGLAARRAGVPALLSRRVDKADAPLVGIWKYRYYQRVIAISGDIHQRLLHRGVPVEKLALVHSAINADGCQPSWSRQEFADEFELGDGGFAVVSVGQLIARKGHGDLLSAWGEVVSKFPGSRLILFGVGAEEIRLREQAQAYGIEDSVLLAGFRADLREFLGHADLLVHPAHREGLGICLLEAQAAGVPVIATRVGGIPEAVQDQVSGILVPAQEPLALTRAIGALLADPGRRRAMGEAGRRYIKQYFSADAMVSGNLSVYRSILEGARHD